MNTTLLIVSVVLFSAIAVVCIFIPDKIQTLALDYYSRNPFAAKLNPFLNWMKTGAYVVTIRIIGCLSLIVAVFLLFVKLFLR